MPYQSANSSYLNVTSFHQNHTNITWSYEECGLHVYIASWLMTVMGIFGVTAGLILLFVVSRQIHTSGSQILIANLVLTYLLESVPLLATVATASDMSLDNCFRSVTYVQIVYATRMWNDVWLSINRFVAIFFPHHYTALMVSPTLNYSLVVLSWLLGLVCVLCMMFLTGVKFSRPDCGFCMFEAVDDRAWSILHSFTVFPYCIIFTASTAVITKSFIVYRQRRSQVEGQPTTHQFRVFRRRLRVALMLFASFMWGTLCQLPVFIINGAFHEVYATHPVMLDYLNVMLMADFIGNPIIFFALSKDYRDSFMRLVKSNLHFLFPRARTSSVGSGTKHDGLHTHYLREKHSQRSSKAAGSNEADENNSVAWRK